MHYLGQNQSSIPYQISPQTKQNEGNDIIITLHGAIMLRGFFRLTTLSNIMLGRVPVNWYAPSMHFFRVCWHSINMSLRNKLSTPFFPFSFLPIPNSVHTYCSLKTSQEKSFTPHLKNPSFPAKRQTKTNFRNASYFQIPSP